MEEKKRSVIELRKPNSIPLYGRLMCVAVKVNELYTKSGIQVPVKKQDLVVVGVSDKVEDKNIVPGCTVIPFAPPTHDGGRTEIMFQTIMEYDHNGRHDYFVVYESELASYLPKDKVQYDVNLIDAKDYVRKQQSDIIIPNNDIVLPTKNQA
jgi:hypothetical protein